MTVIALDQILEEGWSVEQLVGRHYGCEEFRFANALGGVMGQGKAHKNTETDKKD